MHEWVLSFTAYAVKTQGRLTLVYALYNVVTAAIFPANHSEYKRLPR